MKRFLYLMLGLVVVLIMGCGNVNVSRQEDIKASSKIAKNVALMKSEGLFDEILTSSRNVETSEEQEMVQRFINDTDGVLLELEKTEEGKKELGVIHALFGDGTTEDFEKSLAYFDREKALEFSAVINDNFSDIEDTGKARGADLANTIRLSYYTTNTNSRAVFAENMDWSTIGWYTGFCAATVAGCYAASYGGFWTRIVGKIAAVAGAASMTTQLVKWYKCSELFSFATSLKNKDVAEANRIFKTTQGKKILTITAETAGTVLACIFTPFGKKIISTVKHYYNSIMDKIICVLPKGIDFVVCGIHIKKI